MNFLLGLPPGTVPFLPFLMTLLGLHILLRHGLAWRIALDLPNDRSLHTSPTPRMGGVVMVPSVLVAWLLLPEFDPWLAALAAGLCMLSLIDDRFRAALAIRLAGHLTAAVLFVVFGLHVRDPLWVFPFVLGIAWFANLYNFMDGADGLAGGMAVFGFSVYGAAAWSGGDGTLALTCFCVSAAAAGFLCFNFPPARVFMGDAGSVPLGFMAGAIGLLGWVRELWQLWFPILVFAPFVADASLTLARRIFRGENVWLAHREHYYQRLIRMGWGHRRTALSEYALMSVCAVLALILLRAPEYVRIAGLFAATVVLLGLAAMLDRRWRRFAQAVERGR